MLYTDTTEASEKEARLPVIYLNLLQQGFRRI